MCDDRVPRQRSDSALGRWPEIARGGPGRVIPDRLTLLGFSGVRLIGPRSSPHQFHARSTGPAGTGVPPNATAGAPLAVLFLPPLTEAVEPLAVLFLPPLTEAKIPLAVLYWPPLTEANWVLAVLPILG